MEIPARPPGAAADPTPLPQGASTADGEALLRDVYRAMIDHGGDHIGRLFTGLLGEDGLPAVFHCHAGKDRTGVVAALLLESLGVDREAVLDDYDLTARYRLREHQDDSYQRLLDSGMSPGAAAGVLRTSRWAMADALSHLDRSFGGIDAYLTGAAGMSAAEVETLRNRLVAPRA
jgi:protein-tyrosine phosphatase